MVKRFVKYVSTIGPFDNECYVYFNSKNFIKVYKNGETYKFPVSDNRFFREQVKIGFYKETGTVNRKKATKSQKFDKNKMYLFVEPDYIWFCKGEYVIKHKWYKGYELKTKSQLDDECFVGAGKFIIELP